MNCPTCGARTHVLDTRGTVRRRQCKENPAHVFETTERVSFVGIRRAGRPTGPMTRPDRRPDMDRWQGLQ